MNFMKIENYNLEITLLGGQAFNWDFINDSYYGFFKDRIVQIKPELNGFYWQTYPKKNDIEFLNHYLNLKTNYLAKLKKLGGKDKYIKSAVQRYPGLRILNQEFEQTLLSFILSSNKSVKGVRKAVRNLTQAYGEEISVNNISFHLFPSVKELLKLQESDFRKLGFGFRAKYFKEALNRLSEDGALKFRDEDAVRKYLISFIGIGDKVADCIMVFSLGFQNVTPLDVWGKKVLTDFYKVNPKLSYSEMRKWYQNYFGENTALAGQFLFEYIRSLNKS